MKHTMLSGIDYARVSQAMLDLTKTDLTDDDYDEVVEEVDARVAECFSGDNADGYSDYEARRLADDLRAIFARYGVACHLAQ